MTLSPDFNRSKFLYFLVFCQIILNSDNVSKKIFGDFFCPFCFVCLFDLILNVPSTIFQLNRDRSSWVEPVLS